MGQQQLLLLVLGIVIVGLAVVVGIQSFSENQIKANADAQVNDAIRIASDAQAWTLKPQAFGGGNGSFGSLDFTKLGYEVGDTNSTTATAADDEYENLNGIYDMAPATDGSGVQIVGYNESTEVQVTMTVCGTTPEDITTTVATGVAPADAASAAAPTCGSTSGSTSA